MNLTVRNSSQENTSLNTAVKVQFILIKVKKLLGKNCKFDFYCNKTDITPTVLYGGNEITLANWPNDKHIKCNINNDIPVRIPSHPYVLVNRSVLRKLWHRGRISFSFGIFGSMSWLKFKTGYVLHHDCSFC